MQSLQNILGGFSSEQKEFSCATHGAYMSTVIRINGVAVTENRCPVCEEIERKAQAEAEARMQAEIEAKRKQDAIEAAFARSAIPSDYRNKSFDNFVATTDNQRSAVNLCKQFVRGWEKAKKGGYGLLMFGGVGTGKTHLSCAILSDLTPSVAGLYTRTADLVRVVRSTWKKDSEESEFDAVRKFVDIDLLVIDEVGVQSGSANEQQILFSILDARLAENRPTILLSNLSPSQLVPVLGERLVDRIKAKCVPFHFTGKSHRTFASASVFGD